MRWRMRCHRERTLTGAHDAGANPAYPVPRVDVVCAAASAKTRAMARATRDSACEQTMTTLSRPSGGATCVRWRTHCRQYRGPRVPQAHASDTAKTRAMARATRAGTCADAHDGSVLLRATGAWKLLNRAQQLGA